MSDFDWTERFPDMRPVRTPPGLVRVNGIGCGVYGARDHDAETHTYVTTYCFSVLFIPILALTAYRVANAPNGGWYFLGRVPLSGFAKTWNWLVLLAVLCGGGAIVWTSYTHSTDYLAGRKLAEADQLAAAGQLERAAELYRDVAVGSSTHAVPATQRLKGLVDDPRLQTSLGDAAGVFRVAIDLQQRTGVRAGDLEERGLKLLDQHADVDPRGGLALLDALAPVAKDPQVLLARRRSLLERLVAQNPGDIPTVSELALLYEETNQLPRCEPLLLPLKDRLGDSEGARILGQVLLRKDKFEDACAVLEGYTDKHLPELDRARQAYDNSVKALIERVRNGSATGFPYQRFKDADQSAKGEIFQEYLASQIKTEPGLRKVNEEYQRARRAVPAALDLGIVLLRRAQSRRDAEARDKDLQRAEKVFLAIQNDQESQSKAYRLSLGQVYYWLGKHQEGKKQFDEALAAEQRSYSMLMFIGRVLREVGARSEARALFEEAYNKEQDNDKKYQAAVWCSLLASELDDKIFWLQKADPKDVQVKASLSESRAEKALQEGKTAEAEPHLREAIDLYKHMPEDASVLNNCALAYLTLYRVTGERKSLEQAEAMLEKAVALAPRDSILLLNASHALLDAAVRDVIGPAIDLKTLKKSGDRSLLNYLYDDRAGRRALTERLTAHPATVKGVSFLERLLILAPKNAGVYRQLLPLYKDQRNLEGLRALEARLEKTPPDLSLEEKMTREFFAGKRDPKLLKDERVQVERLAKLVQETGRGRRGVTYAVAANDLADAKMTLAMLGEKVDAGELVSLAESAYAAAPSDGTRRALEGVLLFRASQNLSAKDAGYAALRARVRRSVGPTDLLADVMTRDNPMRQAALADADVRRCLELIRETIRKFPDSPNSWAWAMLQASEAAEVARLAKALRDDPFDAPSRAIELKLSPFSASTALRTSWALRAVGKEKEAAAVLKEYAGRGIALPEAP